MKKNKIIFIIAFLLCTFIYVCKIDSIPKNIILYKGENLNLEEFLGLSFKIGNEDYNTVLTSSSIKEEKNVTNIVDVKLFNLVTVKEISVNIAEETTVIPVGQISSLKLYTNGVLVVGMSQIKTEDNKKYKPYENTDIQEGDRLENWKSKNKLNAEITPEEALYAFKDKYDIENTDIQEGDRIIKIDNKEVADTDDLTQIVNNSQGEELKIEYIRGNEYKTCNITPIKGTDGTYKLGLWVRDSAAGIGTLTFYEPSSGNFAALGHGIADSDTGELIEITNGEFLTTRIISITKGLKGTPGRIQGTIENQATIGTIYKNTNLGIYGTVNNLSAIKLDLSKEMKVARRSEISLGDAYVYCNLDETEAKEYKIEIEKIFINNDTDNKSMLIKVKDQELLDKTGGIVQGMSGSPIIQNNKFIGCITNVLVNDATQGYAVFADIMINQMRK